jgi:hypothetical protein
MAFILLMESALPVFGVDETKGFRAWRLRGVKLVGLLDRAILAGI